MIKYQLSDYARKSLVPSAVNEMTEAFALDFREGTDINLGVGYVNDKTIPSEEILASLQEVIADPVRFRNALNYGAAEGSPNLLKALKHYFTTYAVGGMETKHFEDKAVIIGANGATSLLESLAHIFKPGVVITAEPCYYIYTEYLERLGYTVIGVPEEKDGISTEVLKSTMDSLAEGQLRFLYIVTVNNPTGTILSNTKRKAIIDMAKSFSERSGRNVPVVFDRAYEDIIHNESHEKPISAHTYDNSGIVVEIGTLSKILAPALRIGYCIARKSTFTQALIQRVSDIGFSAPLMNQEIAAILLEKHLSTQLTQVKEQYRQKAEYLQLLFDKHLSKYLAVIRGGEAGFYYYLRFNKILTGKASDFHNFLSRTTGDPAIDGVQEKLPRLIYIPGQICTVRNSSIAAEAAQSLRISFGFETLEVLEKAILLIKDAAEYAERK